MKCLSLVGSLRAPSTARGLLLVALSILPQPQPRAGNQDARVWYLPLLLLVLRADL